MQRCPAVGTLVAAGSDVVADGTHRRTQSPHQRKQAQPGVGAGDGRVHQHQPGHLSAPFLGQSQRQGAAHRQAGDDHRSVAGPQLVEGPGNSGQPVLPPALVRVLPGCAVTGQQRYPHRVAPLSEGLRQGAPGRGRAGEAVDQQQPGCPRTRAAGFEGTGVKRPSGNGTGPRRHRVGHRWKAKRRRSSGPWGQERRWCTG